MFVEALLWPEDVGMKSDGLNKAIDNSIKDNKVQDMKDYNEKAKPKANDPSMPK